MKSWSWNWDYAWGSRAVDAGSAVLWVKSDKIKGGKKVVAFLKWEER